MEKLSPSPEFSVKNHILAAKETRAGNFSCSCFWAKCEFNKITLESGVSSQNCLSKRGSKALIYFLRSVSWNLRTLEPSANNHSFVFLGLCGCALSTICWRIIIKFFNKGDWKNSISLTGCNFHVMKYSRSQKTPEKWKKLNNIVDARNLINILPMGLEKTL